jgi:membrane protein required for colicin V production
MNGIDIVIAVCSGGLLVWGLMKGLTRMVMTIIAMFIGLIFATRSYDVIGGWFSNLVGNSSIAMMIGFILAFLAVMVVFTLLGNMIKKVLDSVHLGCLDHILGGIMGFAAGVLLSSIVIIALAVILPQRESVLKESVLAPYVIEFSNVVIKFVPEDLREDFLKKYYDLKRHAEDEAQASLLIDTHHRRRT